ncbi:MAG: hypothetical protein AAB492_02385 [Patescibacteria group bacterium]
MYRISKLLALDRKLLHTQDLALLWGITNTNTLYTTISRHIKAGVLHPVQKGLYSTQPISKVDPYDLGVALSHDFTYVSCETVLANTGVISQSLNAITCISTFSKTIEKVGYRFRFRQLADQFLYQSIGIEIKDEVLWATAERAMADMLYFTPHYHVDNRSQIDWKKIHFIQREMGYV